MKKTVLSLCCVFFIAAAHLFGQTPSGAGNRDFFNEALGSMQRAFDDAESDPTLEDAYFLGRSVAAHIFGVYSPYTQDPELVRYVNKICQTLVINSSRPAAFRGFSATVLDTQEFNAFATPGGHIFLTKALVDAAKSEDMLAAVLAHELAHINLDHGLEMIRAMSLPNEATAMANRAADFAGNTADVARLMLFRNSVSTLVDTMMKSGYSQAQEFAADREAVAILAASGYNPSAMQEMLRVLQREQRSNKGGFFATHPTPASRINNIKRTIKQYRVPDTSSHRRSRFLSR